MLLFLCGDVMLGRGIDQILPYPGDPGIHEHWMRSAEGYVRLAEAATGPIPRRAPFPYVWGDALAELERLRPQARIINLETAVTAGGLPWPDKGIHYRMHPANSPCLSAAGIDAAVLANNHVLDWGVPGLLDTLEALDRMGIAHAGAGRTLEEARRPAIVPAGPSARILVFAFGSTTSGIPPEWAATTVSPGLFVIEEREDFLTEIRDLLLACKRPGDVAIASVHWEGNWGYAVEDWQGALAHRLIEAAGFDMVHGHSSHHVKGIEVHRDKLILYGCGDFLNDYEGISGYREFRPELSLMYFPTWDGAAGRLAGLRMLPMRTHRFQSVRAGRADAEWLAALLNREGRRFGTRAEMELDGALALRWE